MLTRIMEMLRSLPAEPLPKAAAAETQAPLRTLGAAFKEERKVETMAQVSLNAFLANRLRQAGSVLGAACEKMPEDRLTWHPTTEGNPGRDALDQLVECGYLNEWAAAAFRNAALPPFSETDYKQRKDANRNKTAALRWLQQGTNALAAAVEAFPPDKLGDSLSNPFNGENCTWAEFADFFYWNTIYHEGQVNYIQVLYGDMS